MRGVYFFLKMRTYGAREKNEYMEEYLYLENVVKDNRIT